MKSRYQGKCTICGDDIHVGDDISRYGETWDHSSCVMIMKNRELVNSGETFRSQRKSDYHRGKSPGAHRSRM